ncbi:MAG: acyl-CoA dehydrogenase family protein [Chloroflexi bacterium]|nr:acyl-CoA dehydrogenase family protein [Chloroflexota bacterium]
MDFELTPEQKLIRDLVWEVAQAEFAPRAHEVDETGRFPQENFAKLAELNLLGLPWPEEYGGAGADTVSLILAVEEIAKACGSTALSYAAHVSLASAPIYNFGSEEQKRKYLVPLATGKWLGAFGLTEPHSGSDAAALRTTARLKGEEWVLNGRKAWTTNGSVAQVVVLAARTREDKGEEGISNFIVETNSPGFKSGKEELKMGLHGSVTSELIFDDCHIPQQNLLGEEGKGFKQFLKILDGGRIGIGAMALGLGHAALEAAKAYAKERTAFGRPIAQFQAIQTMIANAATELSAARLLVYQAAWRKDKGLPYRTEAAMAKLFASEAAERACRDAIQIFGGYGYSREFPVERYYRDNRLTTIGEGTSEIQRIVIARQVLGLAKIVDRG